MLRTDLLLIGTALLLIGLFGAAFFTWRDDELEPAEEDQR